jgi:ATP-dependent Clp protease ATP-binding subunit ClpC
MKSITASSIRRTLEGGHPPSRRYLMERFLPDKAIDLMDEAGSRKKIDNAVRPLLGGHRGEIQALNEEKLSLVSSQNYEGAAAVRTG